MKRCPNPFEGGVVDGQWVGLVIHFSGGNGGADSVTAITTGFGGNGALTTVLGKIMGLSVANGIPADGLLPIFHKGKLWILNYVHLPGQSHFDITNEGAQQFGFEGKTWRREASAIVPINSSDAYIEGALARTLSH